MITLSNGDLRVRISPIGAQTQAILWHDRPLLWPGDAQIWPDHAPLLFPIVGRARDGIAAVDGTRADMPIHGFARFQPFTLTEQTQTSCQFDLSDSAQTRTIYPRAFHLCVRHDIGDGALTIRVTVANPGESPLPFGIGLHPGFLWPLPGLAGEPHDIRLIPASTPEPFQLDQGLIVGPRLASPFQDGVLPITDATFAQDSSIVLTDAGSQLFYGANDGRGLHLSWSGFAQLVLWHPVGAGFLCVEPWQGLPARTDTGPEIADRPFSVTLAPGDTAQFSMRIDPRALPR